MGVKKFVGTALLTIAATAVSAGTVHAAPASPKPVVISGSDRGVSYYSTLSPDLTGIRTTLRGGRFVLARDRTAVEVAAPNGTVVARVPLAWQLAGRWIRLQPDIGRNGNTLTVRPHDRRIRVSDVAGFNKAALRMQQSALQPGTGLKFVGATGAVLGALLAGIVGAVIGLLIGAVFLLVGAIPGIVVGFAIGFVIGGILGWIFI